MLRWSQRVIDLADGDPSKGNFIIGSPLALAFTSRAMARYCLGRPGWRDDLRHGLAMARSADPLSYATVVTYVYFAGIPYGVLRPDDSAVREIEDALRIAERSGDDLALAFARMTLGVALVHRQTAAERDRGQKLLAEVSEVFVRRDTTCAIYRSSTCTWRVRGLGVEIAMTPYRSCAPPSTICSARDNCWRGAFQRPVFWWRHCSIAAPTVTWPKPRPRSSGWRPRQPTRVWLCATSGCCGCALCWRGLTATRPPTATIGIATATWRHRLASRGTWSGPRRCHDGGRPESYPRCLEIDHIQDSPGASEALAG